MAATAEVLRPGGFGNKNSVFCTLRTHRTVLNVWKLFLIIFDAAERGTAELSRAGSVLGGLGDWPPGPSDENV